MNNTKVIITFSYLDYLFIKNMNLKNIKLINITDPYNFNVFIDFKSLKLLKYSINVKLYKLDNIFSSLVGYDEYYFFISKKEYILNSYVTLKYIKKYLNDEAITLGFNLEENINKENFIDYILQKSFNIKKEEYYNLLYKKILDNTIKKYLSLFYKNKYGNYLSLDLELLKIIELISKYKSNKTDKYILEENEKIKQDKFNFENININNKNILYIYYILFPNLSRKEIYRLQKFLFKEYSNYIKYNEKYNIYFLDKNDIEFNKFGIKKRIFIKLFWLLGFLLKNDNLEIIKYKLIYKNIKKEKLIKEIFKIKNEEELFNNDEELLLILDLILNKNFIFNEIIFKKNEINFNILIEKLLKETNIDFNTFIYKWEYIKKKNIVYYNNNYICKLNNKSLNIINLFQSIINNIDELIDELMKKEIKNKIDNKEKIIKNINLILEKNFSKYMLLFNIPSIRMLNKYKKIKNINDENLLKNLSKEEILKTIIEYEKKQKATEKQKKLIKEIFNKNKIKNLTIEKVISNKYNASKFLFKFFLKKPSKKQIEFLKKIENKYNLNIDKKIYKDKKLLNNYLKNFI